jgi:hypothetical protein
LAEEELPRRLLAYDANSLLSRFAEVVQEELYGFLFRELSVLSLCLLGSLFQVASELDSERDVCGRHLESAELASGGTARAKKNGLWRLRKKVLPL